MPQAVFELKYWKERHRLARSLSWREPEFNPGVHMVEGES